LDFIVDQSLFRSFICLLLNLLCFEYLRITLLSLLMVYFQVLEVARKGSNSVFAAHSVAMVTISFYYLKGQSLS
jgi:hypothetical protein